MLGNGLCLLKAMSHEAICPCNLIAMQFLPKKKYCRLQLGCQTYAIRLYVSHAATCRVPLRKVEAGGNNGRVLACSHEAVKIC